MTSSIRREVRVSVDRPQRRITRGSTNGGTPGGDAGIRSTIRRERRDTRGQATGRRRTPVPANSAMTVYAKARLELKNGLSAKYFHLLPEAAEAGNAEAMCDLGLWLLDGCRDSMGRTLVRRSSSKGYHLVSRAAAAGNSMALLTRGTCLADGVGVRANRAAAKRLLRAAARA